MAVEPFAVLDQLKTLSPNQVYFLAPKGSVLRGYEYYAQARVESYHWNRTQTILSASVRGSKYYVVTFSMHEGTLVYSCRCPAWTPGSQCKHVICALLTTVNLLSPDSFRIPSVNARRQTTLSHQLLGDSGALQRLPKGHPSAARFEISLVDREGEPSVVITNHGKVCQSFVGMPTELAVLLRATQDVAWSVQEGLRNFLVHHGGAFPLFFENESGRHVVQWTDSVTFMSKTEMDIVGTRVNLAARCVRYGEVHHEVHVFMGLVVDVNNHKLGVLENEEGWLVYDTLYEQAYREQVITGDEFSSGVLNSLYVSDAQLAGRPLNILGRPRMTFSVPVERFFRLQFDVEIGERSTLFRSVLLKIEGRECPVPNPSDAPPVPPVRRRVTVSVSEPPSQGGAFSPEAEATLRLESCFGDCPGRPSFPLFSFFPYVAKSRSLSRGLKAKHRRALLTETFFRLCQLSKGSEIRKTIRDCLKHEAFQAFSVKREAEHMLGRFAEPLLEPTARLTVHRGHWCLVPNDSPREAQLYAVPYGIWGPSMFDGMKEHHEFVLPWALVSTKLPALYAQLQKAGIELLYQDKPVVESKWEYSLDARHSSSIDWFELRPEIVCDGVRVEPQDLEKLLEQGGVMEAGGSIRMIDQQTQEILRAFAALSPQGRTRKGRTEKMPLVRVPRLQMLDWVALRKRGVTVRLPPEDDALIDRLLHFERIEPVVLPTRLKGKLRPYQQDGYRWLGFLYSHRLGACLADDMGLGKTLQAISLFGGIKEGIIHAPRPIHAPHLVVLPPSLLFNWEREIARFYPDLAIRLYTGKERRLDFSQADIVLTTYGLVRRDIAKLEACQFNIILFDEAQAVKNIVTRTTGAARRLRGYFKCVMTGTPLENHIGEYYSLIDLCVPGLLGEYEDLKGNMKNPSSSVVDTMMARTKPFVLRRTKSQILKELPPKVETDLYLELTDRQKVLYQDTVARIRTAIAAAYQTKSASQARIMALTAILQLRQICLSPRLLHPDHADISPKITFVVERLQELMEEGHSALVFSQFTSFLDLVEHGFHGHHIPYVRLDGSTPTKQRKKVVQEFQESAAPSVFLLSLKAGGQGLNLTKASYVFHLDPWWNPAVENQASDRAHRIGQARKVSIMRLLMRHTIEEKMMKLKEQKLELYHAVLEGATHRGGSTGLTQQDFEFLLG